MCALQVLLVAGTHGNEENASWLFDQLEKKLWGLNKKNIDVFSVIGNPEAREANLRYIDRDLNRCFHSDLLSDIENQDFEVTRARYLLDIFGPSGKIPCQIIFDFHSTTSYMGNSLVVYGRRPSDLALAGLIQHQLGLPIYLHEGDLSQQGFMVTSWPCGLVIEIGATPQGLLVSKTIIQTKLALEACLDQLSFVRDNIANIPRNIIIHRHIKSIDFPRDENGNRIAFIHPEREGKDWVKINKGDPLFMNSSGETYIYSENTSYIPVFINEASYFEKNIAMSFTKREILPFSNKWLQSLSQLIDK